MVKLYGLIDFLILKTAFGKIFFLFVIVILLVSVLIFLWFFLKITAFTIMFPAFFGVKIPVSFEIWASEGLDTV